ncbi:PAS domain S-box protein [Hymenobacter sp. ASUV-10]|uniref:histidine kinase n=1 Tax=Hymenobacter aranciens TaxID=3063996 RepID=A0ABT9BGT6_9BACT|nr:PAS domain S-box protein [Hymenobacter sp. ASUV-10]MDO7877474.1 PAS domain S-box protein [Hymenobacter sp. ASUV-10]
MDETATPDPADRTPLPEQAALLRLRERADERRRLATAAAPHAPEEVQRLLLELQTHQIELEMQHEELLLARAEADALRLQYTDLYEFAPVGYLTLRPDETIAQLNLFAARLLGGVRQRLLHQHFLQFVAAAHRARFTGFMGQVLHSADTQYTELELLRDNGRPFFAQLQGLSRPDAQGRPQCQLVILDIEERRRAADALAASEARFRATFEQSADGMLLLDGPRIVEANRAAARLLQLPNPAALRGQSLARFWPEHQPDGRRSHTLLAECLHQASTTGWSRLEWTRRPAAPGPEVWDELSFSPVVVNGQLLLHCLWRDTTAPRAVAQRLRQEQEFSNRLLENSVDGIAAVDRHGRLTAWNARIVEYTGLRAAQVLGRPVIDVLGHFNTATHKDGFQRVLAGEAVTLLSQPFRYREGRYDAYLVPMRDGDELPINGVLCIVRDVTERDRLAEEATQLRLRQQKEVLAAVLDTQESERKRIAEALHNGLGQLLYATKLNLEGQHTPAAEAAQELLKEAIQATRRISFELTPGILEDFGLRAALEEIVKRIGARQLRVSLHPVGLEKPLPAPVEIAVYRITQELLNNVMKHAQATEARIYVVRENARLELTVEDNGVGFAAARLATEPLGGIGLTGVRNRVLLLGGTLDIDSRQGKGTIVSIELGF